MLGLALGRSRSSISQPSPHRGCSMDHSLAKELKEAGFPQDGKNCRTYTNITDSTLVERIVHPTLSELIEACPKQLGIATFVLGSANHGQVWVACYFDFEPIAAPI